MIYYAGRIGIPLTAGYPAALPRNESSELALGYNTLYFYSGAVSESMVFFLTGRGALDDF